MFFLGFATLVILVFFMFQAESRKLANIFTNLSRSYGGELKKPWWTYPQLKIKRRDLVYSLSATPAGKARSQSLHLHVACKHRAEYEFIIRRRNLTSRLDQTLGLGIAPNEIKNMSELLSKDPEFDKQFLILTSNNELLETVVDVTLRSKLLQLTKYTNFIDVRYLNAENEPSTVNISLSLQVFPRNLEIYEKLIDLTDSISEKLFAR